MLHSLEVSRTLSVLLKTHSRVILCMCFPFWHRLTELSSCYWRQSTPTPVTIVTLWRHVLRLPLAAMPHPRAQWSWSPPISSLMASWLVSLSEREICMWTAYPIHLVVLSMAGSFQTAIPSHIISGSKIHPSWLCFSPVVSLFLTGYPKNSTLQVWGRCFMCNV